MSFTLRPNNTGASIGEEREPAPATPAPATFEVTKIGNSYRKGLFRTKFVPITMKATTAITYEKDVPGRQKSGSVWTNKSCAKFDAGASITINFPAKEIPSLGEIFVGKELSALDLRARGYLEPYYEQRGGVLWGPFAKPADGGYNS